MNKRKIKKILVIENNKNTLEEITVLLMFESLMVYPAENVFEGLQIIEEEFPDLVLININIAKRDDFKILKQLNNGSAKIRIPFIYFMTDGIQDLSAEKLYLTDNLNKPLIPLFLTDYINTIFDFNRELNIYVNLSKLISDNDKFN